MTKKDGMFPPNQPVKVDIYNNGDIEYITPLPEMIVEAFSSDRDLGPTASYDQYHEWYLNNLRTQATHKAQYARAGFAPLTTKASDSAIIEGEYLESFRRQFGDTIQKRHENGFYDKLPYILQMDSALYNRMEKPLSGFSCINSNTSYYGPRFADMSNLHFQQFHHGFLPVSLDSLQKGDIVQLRRPWKSGKEAWRPYHAVMFDNYTTEGDINAWDQHGAVREIVPEQTKSLFQSPDDPNNKIPRAMNAYRFIGDEKTEEEIRKGYEAYRKRNNLQD